MTLSPLVLQIVSIFLLHYLCCDLSFFLRGMIEFENSTADTLAYFQSVRIPRSVFRPWVFLDFGQMVGAFESKKFKLHRGDLERFAKIQSASKFTI